MQRGFSLLIHIIERDFKILQLTQKIMMIDVFNIP